MTNNSMMTSDSTLSAAVACLPSGFKRVVANRWLCLAIGAAVSFFAVGARWDIAIAAWVAPVFLLCFVRSSRPFVGLPVLLLVSIANAFWWLVQFAVPLSPLNILFSALLSLLYTLPYAVDRLVASRLSTAWRFLAFPAAIAACEFAIGTASPLGATYGLRAITQSDNVTLLQMISVTGPYGIGFLIGWFATTLNQIFVIPAAYSNSMAAGHHSTGLLAGLFAVVLLAALAGGGARLAFGGPGADAAYVTVAGITPNKSLRNGIKTMFSGNSASDIARFGEADRAKLRAAYSVVNDELLDSTRQAAKAGAQIVVWSETASTSLAVDKPELLKRGGEVARENDIYLVLANGEPFASNETELLDPKGSVLWSYQKRHPVPGMEPISPGSTLVPVVNTPFGKLSNVICYDADFPALLRTRADIMFVPGWDWPEIGASHTLKMARLRAIENGYSLVRIAYDSQSAAFDYLGNVLATQDTTGSGSHVMFADVPIHGVKTVYNRIGDLFAWLCVLGLLLAITLAVRANFRPKLDKS